MSYIGNNLQVAFPSYTNIDDISGSFNGVLKTFALTVKGAAPVPLPINSQQCLISVNGVIQRPDDTGTEGFRLSGGNIVFSSAPSAGWKFFGIILAGADYVNVGVKYPNGSLAAPSITFDSDLDTGFYNYGANQIGVSCGGVLSTVFTSSGYGFGAGTAAAPGLFVTGDTNTGFYSPGADQLSIATGGTERLRVDSAGQVEAVSLGTAAAPTFSFTTNPNTGIYSPGADQLSIATGGTERLRVDSAGQLEAISLGTASAPTFSFTTDPNTGIYSPGADQLAISTGGSGRLFVDASGNVGVGAAPSVALEVKTTTPIIRSTHSTTSSSLQLFHNGSGAFIDYSANDLIIRSASSTERLRITSTGALNFVGAGTAGSTQAVSFNGSAPVNSLVIDSSGNATFGSNVTLNAQGDLRFADADSSNWVAFQAPSTVVSNVTWTLPSADGSANQVLTTNGSGTLTWSTPSGGIGRAEAYFFSGF